MTWIGVGPISTRCLADHGATGVVMALAGLALMLHDRRDYTRWFARGWQSQD